MCPLLRECRTGLRGQLWQRIQHSGHMWRRLASVEEDETPVLHRLDDVTGSDMLPRHTCGMRRRMQTCSHRWNSRKSHAMSNPDPPSFPIFVIKKNPIIFP